MINYLRNKFPSLKFTLVSEKINQRNENAFYPFGSPKPEVIKGEFIRIETPIGGVEVISIKNVEAIYRLADWHQKRATANGY